MRYTVVVHRGETPNELAFGAEVVELPGCFTTGNSLDELEINLHEAVTLYREGCEEKYPEPTSFLLQLELPRSSNPKAAQA